MNIYLVPPLPKLQCFPKTKTCITLMSLSPKWIISLLHHRNKLIVVNPSILQKRMDK